MLWFGICSSTLPGTVSHTTTLAWMMLGARCLKIWHCWASRAAAISLDGAPTYWRSLVSHRESWLSNLPFLIRISLILPQILSHRQRPGKSRHHPILSFATTWGHRHQHGVH